MDGEGTESPGVLQIRVAQGPADWAIAHEMLDEEHLLGAGREAGDRLCQFVLEEGQPVAVLVWCAAAWHLKDRDERIGWDAVTRSQRLKLVVQLRRFLVVEATRRPNLASQCLDQRQREAIGLRVRHKESGLLKMPGYDALNDLFHLLDPGAYARALTAWFQANSGLLPRSLALDGKSIGDGKCGMIITLCRHEDDRPVAMIPASGKKEDCEVSEARALLADPQVRLENALVTADPIHNNQATVGVIAEKGGDYLIGTEENTPKRHEATVQALRDTPFLQ
jgi:hypothetical protein